MALAPLGHRVAQSNQTYVAVIFAGHKQIRLLGLFPLLMDALAYVKANYKCDPLGTSRFVTEDGEVLIVQRGVHILQVVAS